MDYKDILAFVKEEYKKAIERHTKRGENYSKADEHAYDICIGIVKAFQKLGMITPEQYMDILSAL